MLTPNFLLTNLDLEQDAYPLSVLFVHLQLDIMTSLQSSLGDTDYACPVYSSVANPVSGTLAQLNK